VDRRRDTLSSWRGAPSSRPEAEKAPVPTDPKFYVLAVIAVTLTGLSKGGFSGVGSLAMPLLALAMAPVRAAAILLPILVLQDAFSVYAFRKTYDRAILATMLPGAAVGVVLAALLASRVSPKVILGILGVISLVFGLHRLHALIFRPLSVQSTLRHGTGERLLGAGLGAASGFTSQIAHAGQPPFQIYILRKSLAPTVMIGTSAMYYGAINLMKLPAYAALGQFTAANLATAAVLAPVAVASTAAGVRLVRRIDASRFYVLIFALMALVGVQLIWEALRT
jgi:hypothetical protein